MATARKKAISLRLNVSDIESVKLVSRRLGVRDSDVIRYAIQALLLKVSPLADPAVKGRSLVPLFLGAGAEIVRHFALDARRLGSVINENVDAACAVSPEDLHLIAMTGASESSGASPSASRTGPATGERRADPMRRYLFEKYLFRSNGGDTGA